MQALDRVGHDGRVHDLALDDGVVHHRGERHLGEDRLARGVRDRDELDQAAPDVEADRRRVAPEESHTCPLVEGWLRPAALAPGAAGAGA